MERERPLQSPAPVEERILEYEQIGHVHEKEMPFIVKFLVAVCIVFGLVLVGIGLVWLTYPQFLSGLLGM